MPIVVNFRDYLILRLYCMTNLILIIINFSSKRDELFRTYQEFTEVPTHKVLKHGSTRWLSLEKCVNRTLEQWPALTSYFLSEADNLKAQKIQERLVDHEMKLYFMFLQVQLPIFNKFNLLFQVNVVINHWYIS